MPFFIPFIIGAIAAASIGTSVANNAMDGALFAPEINQYKADIKREEQVNKGLVSEINRQNALFDSQVERINATLSLASDVGERFMALESDAASLATQVVLDESNQFYFLPEVEQSTLSVVATSGIVTMGSLQVNGILNDALADTRLGQGVGAIGNRFQNAYQGLIHSPRLSSITHSRAVVQIAQRAPVTAKVLNASAKVAQIGAKVGVRAATSAASKLAGPFSIVIDVGFLIADVIASKEKAREYKKVADELVAANNELRGILSDINKAQIALNEDEVILNRETLELVKYTGMILAANFPEAIAELPADMRTLDGLKNKSSLGPNDLTTLFTFIDARGTEFVTRRNNFYLFTVKNLKGYLEACSVSPEALVDRVPFVAILGIDFIRFLAETQFSEAFTANFVPEQCTLNLSDAEPVNGYTARSSDLAHGKIRQVSQGYWVYTDAAGNHHPYNETFRDDWSVYLASLKQSNQFLQLDLWRRELLTYDQQGERHLVDQVDAAYIFERNEFAPISAAPYELDQDRPGADYRILQGMNPNECARQCGVDPVCRAFTWHPGTEFCFFKDVAQGQVAKKHSRYRSGVKL